MGKTLVFYREGLRYLIVLSEGKETVLQQSDKAQVFISGLEESVTLRLEDEQLFYSYKDEEGQLVSGASIAQGRFFILVDDQIILDPLDKLELTIGHHSGNSFVVQDGTYHLLVKRVGLSWRLYRLSGEIYLNNVLLRQDEIELALGDEITFEDNFFKFYQDEILVRGKIAISGELARKASSRYAFYEDYPDYHRSPRIIYRSSEDRIHINAPSAVPSKPTDGLVKLILPPLMMVGVTLVIMVFQPRGLYVLATIAMSLLTTAMSISGYIKSRKDYQKDLMEREQLYHDYLADKSKELAGLSKSQKEGQLYHYPSVETLTELAEGYHHRIYEKTPLHFDFLYYRLGLGEVPVSFDLNYAQTERSGKRDPLELEGFELYEQNKQIKDMPIVANLSHGPVGYIGPRTLVIEQLQLMVNQLAMFHSYHDVQFITIMPEEEKVEWDWMRFLPHATLQDMNVRGFVYNQRTHDQVLNSLNQILKLRKAQKEDKSNRESTLFSPHYVVLITDEKLILDHLIMEFFTEDPTDLGCSLIFVQDVMSSLSENIKTIINIKDRNTGQLVMEEGHLREVDFALDHFPAGYDKERLVRRLAPLNHLQNLKSSIPDVVTFMEMYGVETVEELGVVERWASHAPYKSLAVPIGLRGQEDLVYLNLHEKAHGPHGLIAGTTGSGKSEVIQSYILSLAVNFHPHDVAFLLIDYKGGGMANLFKDLPHLLGTITNLDGPQSMRALVSINAELKRRQRLFAENGVNHINQYQKKYKLGEVEEPMPHLFLISDEFAELKTNQPDFMKELVSTARIGRSLGIHLILATQKPSGVVDDQIWSNSRFKLALKVADRSDSMEMLKTPDASEITQVGRGYLQVGNNEVYELFQSAWSGADYQPDKDEQGIEDHTIYAINDLGQYEILNEDLSGLEQAESIKEVPSELHAIVGKIQSLVEKMSIKALPQPWLPPLPERLFMEDLRGDNELTWSGVNEELEVLLGLLDKPSQQAQAPLFINLSRDGHLLMYGAPATGKTTFLQTAVLDLARHYSPSELHFYLLDFGTSGLVPMGELPHVADVFLLDQGEKIGKFIRLLEKEINRRKKLLTEHRVGTLSMYRQLTGQVEPRIIIVLDSFESTKDESFEADLLKLLTRISREGQAIGLHLIVTASRQANLRATLYSNFKHQLTLKQHDKTEVRSIVGMTSLAEIEDIKGRALYKGEEVYSLQLALPLRVEHDLELVDQMREEVGRQKAAWTGQVPEGIPMVPEELTREDFLSRASVQKAIASGQIPLGLDLETVEAVGWDLTVGNFVYICEQDRHRSNFLRGVLNTLGQTNYSVKMVSGEEFFTDNGAEVSFTPSGRLLMIDEIYDSVIENIEFDEYDETVIVIWNELDVLVQEDSQLLDKILYILTNGPKVGIYSLIVTMPSLSSKIDIVSKHVKLMKEALVETRLNDQKILSLNNVKYSEPTLQESLAYFITNKNYKLMKTVREEFA